MKKILAGVAFAALTLTAVAASAAPVTAFATYDGEKLAGSKTVISEASAGLATTVLGFGVDAAGVAATTNVGLKNSGGFEAGVSHAAPTVLGIETSVRAAYGRRYEDGGRDFNYYVGEVDLRKPLTSDIALIGGYRYRNSFGGSNDFRTNRVSAGLELGLTKHWATNVVYTHTEGTNLTGNGAVATLFYKF